MRNYRTIGDVTWERYSNEIIERVMIKGINLKGARLHE